MRFILIIFLILLSSLTYAIPAPAKFDLLVNSNTGSQEIFVSNIWIAQCFNTTSAGNVTIDKVGINIKSHAGGSCNIQFDIYNIGADEFPHNGNVGIPGYSVIQDITQYGIGWQNITFPVPLHPIQRGCIVGRRADGACSLGWLADNTVKSIYGRNAYDSDGGSDSWAGADRVATMEIWAAPSSAINVQNNTVNFTSDGGQICGFDGSSSTVCGRSDDTPPSGDTTPTFTFSTVSHATCKLWNESVSYDSLEALGVANCSTTGNETHICTVVGPLLDGTISTLYASCKHGGDRSTSYIDANIFEYSLNTSKYLQLDGIEGDNLIYEYETTASIESNLGFISIYDDTFRFLNKSIGVTDTISYVLSVLRIPISNSNKTTGLILDGFVDNRSDIHTVRFNLTGIGDVNNTVLRFGESDEYQFAFPNLLVGRNLFQDKFSYTGVEYLQANITFASAETKQININYSTRGNLSFRKGYFNFTIRAKSLDAANAFSNNERLTNSTNQTNTTNFGTVSPTGSIDGLNQTYEPFVDNRTEGDWVGGTYRVSATKCYQNYLGGDTGCIQEALGNELGSIYYSVVDWSNVSYANSQIALALSCASSAPPEAIIEFTDLTNNVEIFSIEPTGCPAGGQSANYFGNMSLTQTSTNEWTIYEECKQVAVSGCVGGSRSSTVSTATLSAPYYLRLRGPAGDTNTQKTLIFKNLNIGGIYLNRTNLTFTGIEGPDAVTITGNHTSYVLNTTAEVISRATLTWVSIEPSGTSVVGYLSNDNVTFETVNNGEAHRFDSSGNNLIAKFKLSTTSNATTPIVHSYIGEIVPSALAGLEIDIGCDTTKEINYDFELNETSTPVYSLVNDSDINSYLISCNNDSSCEIPLCLVSGSGGVVEFMDLNLTEDINPVLLDADKVQNLSNITVTPTFGGGGTLEFFDIAFDYRGSKNITISAHNGSYNGQLNRTIEIIYSPFELLFPSGQLYWEIFPTSRNESDIQPYGQNSSHGIWQVNSTEYHHQGVEIYAQYNESIDSCVTQMRFKGNNLSQANNSIQSVNITDLTTSGQLITTGLNNTNAANIWTYTDIACSEATANLILPYFCFNSICRDCIHTADWDTNCLVYS